MASPQASSVCQRQFRLERRPLASRRQLPLAGLRRPVTAAASGCLISVCGASDDAPSHRTRSHAGRAARLPARDALDSPGAPCLGGNRSAWLRSPSSCRVELDALVKQLHSRNETSSRLARLTACRATPPGGQSANAAGPGSAGCSLAPETRRRGRSVHFANVLPPKKSPPTRKKITQWFSSNYRKTTADAKWLAPEIEVCGCSSYSKYGQIRAEIEKRTSRRSISIG